MRSFQLLSSLLFAAVSLPTCIATELEVETTAGKFIGTTDTITPDVKQWLGIPFAEAPLGALRFRPPIPKAPSPVAVLAKSPPPSCQQYFTGKPNIFDLVPEYNPSPPYSEDCLFLNVLAPKQPKHQRLPVLVWIHGGEFTYGGINVPYERPQKWIQRSQEHIIVQINYRLNLLGFANAPGINQSELNVGFRDVRLGIEWVRDNIASFGGDPSKIVLWGLAAGSGIVDAYQYAHYNDPIARGIIQQSAVITQANLGADLNQTTWSWVANQFNCTGSAHQVIECMRSVDAAALEQLLKTHTDSAAAPTLYLGPAVDNITGFSQAQYLEMAASKSIPKLPTLVGSTSHEGSNLVPYDAEGVNITEKAIEEKTLAGFQCPMAKESAARVQGGGKTWRFFYSGNFSNISPKPWMGAYHFSNLPLITGTHADFRGNSTPFEYALSAKMQDLWLAFIKDPEHGLTAAKWPQYTGPNGTMLVFGENNTLVQTRSVAVVDAGLKGVNCTV